MMAAFVTMALAYSYIFGINGLSRIFPSIVESQPVFSFINITFIIDATTPVVLLVGSLVFIWISLRDVRAQKYSHGIRPEVALIASSLLVMAITLQFLTGRIQPTGTVNDILELAGLVLAAAAMGVIASAFIHKFFSGRKNHQD
jgi:hypothetical protein